MRATDRRTNLAPFVENYEILFGSCDTRKSYLYNDAIDAFKDDLRSWSGLGWQGRSFARQGDSLFRFALLARHGKCFPL